jgi:RNA polymerase sigma-70 factor, ECF subfamily
VKARVESRRRVATGDILTSGPQPLPMSPDTPSVEPDATDTLIQRCLAGDQAAWEQIVRTNRRRVFNIAYKFTGRHDLAEDLTQDVFVKIFKSLDTFDRRANFQTWLVSVSRNLCIDHYRSVRKEREAIDRDVDPGDLAPVANTTSPYQSLEQRDRASLLRRGLAELAPTLREAVLLRDLQELSYQEIADKLGLPEGTVKSRINRGRNELARQISRIRESDDKAIAARIVSPGGLPSSSRSGVAG